MGKIDSLKKDTKKILNELYKSLNIDETKRTQVIEDGVMKVGGKFGSLYSDVSDNDIEDLFRQYKIKNSKNPKDKNLARHKIILDRVKEQVSAENDIESKNKLREKYNKLCDQLAEEGFVSENEKDNFQLREEFNISDLNDCLISLREFLNEKFEIPFSQELVIDKVLKFEEVDKEFEKIRSWMKDIVAAENEVREKYNKLCDQLVEEGFILKNEKDNCRLEEKFDISDLNDCLISLREFLNEKFGIPFNQELVITRVLKFEEINKEIDKKFEKIRSWMKNINERTFWNYYSPFCFIYPQERKIEVGLKVSGINVLFLGEEFPDSLLGALGLKSDDVKEAFVNEQNVCSIVCKDGMLFTVTDLFMIRKNFKDIFNNLDLFYEVYNGYFDEEMFKYIEASYCIKNAKRPDIDFKVYYPEKDGENQSQAIVSAEENSENQFDEYNESNENELRGNNMDYIAILIKEEDKDRNCWNVYNTDDPAKAGDNNYIGKLANEEGTLIEPIWFVSEFKFMKNFSVIKGSKYYLAEYNEEKVGSTQFPIKECALYIKVGLPRSDMPLKQVEFDGKVKLVSIEKRLVESMTEKEEESTKMLGTKTFNELRDKFEKFVNDHNEFVKQLDNKDIISSEEHTLGHATLLLWKGEIDKSKIIPAKLGDGDMEASELYEKYVSMGNSFRPYVDSETRAKYDKTIKFNNNFTKNSNSIVAAMNTQLESILGNLNNILTKMKSEAGRAVDEAKKEDKIEKKKGFLDSVRDFFSGSKEPDAKETLTKCVNEINSILGEYNKFVGEHNEFIENNKGMDIESFVKSLLGSQIFRSNVWSELLQPYKANFEGKNLEDTVSYAGYIGRTILSMYFTDDGEGYEVYIKPFEDADEVVRKGTEQKKIEFLNKEVGLLRNCVGKLKQFQSILDGQNSKKVVDAKRTVYITKINDLVNNYNEFVKHHNEFIKNNEKKSVVEIIGNDMADSDYNPREWTFNSIGINLKAKNSDSFSDIVNHIKTIASSVAPYFNENAEGLKKWKDNEAKIDKKDFSSVNGDDFNKLKDLDEAFKSVESMVGLLNTKQDKLGGSDILKDFTKITGTVGDAINSSEFGKSEESSEIESEYVTTLMNSLHMKLKEYTKEYEKFKLSHLGFLGTNNEAAKEIVREKLDANKFNISTWENPGTDTGVTWTVRDVGKKSLYVLLDDYGRMAKVFIKYFNEKGDPGKKYADLIKEADDKAGFEKRPLNAGESSKKQFVSSAITSLGYMIVELNNQQKLLNEAAATKENVTEANAVAEPVNHDENGALTPVPSEVKPIESDEKPVQDEKSKQIEEQLKEKLKKELSRRVKTYNGLVAYFNIIFDRENKNNENKNENNNMKSILPENLKDNEFWNMGQKHNKYEYNNSSLNDVNSLAGQWGKFATLLISWLPEDHSDAYKGNLNKIRGEVVGKTDTIEKLELMGKYNVMAKKMLDYIESVVRGLLTTQKEDKVTKKGFLNKIKNKANKIVKKGKKSLKIDDDEKDNLALSEGDFKVKVDNAGADEKGVRYVKHSITERDEYEVFRLVAVDLCGNKQEISSRFSTKPDLKAFKKGLEQALKISNLTEGVSEQVSVKSTLGVLFVSIAYLPGGSEAIEAACKGLSVGGIKGSKDKTIQKAYDLMKKVKKYARKGIVGHDLVKQVKSDIGHFVNEGSIPKIESKFSTLIKLKHEAKNAVSTAKNAIKGAWKSVFGKKSKSKSSEDE